MSDPNPADTYFATRYGASAIWAALSEADKTALVTTATNDLTAAYGALESTDAVNKCIYEQALARLLDDGIDARMALAAQGVTEAGIVKEKYAGKTGVFVCAYAQQVLGSVGSGIALGAVYIEPDDSADTTSYYVQ